jgi:hypothetical protein
MSVAHVPSGSVSALLLVLGLSAVVGAAALGQSGALIALVVTPPGPVRAFFALAALLIGLALVLRAAERLGSDPEPRAMIRGVRLVFLAVAAFAAAGGWLIGSPLPVIAGLVVAGIDVAETSFLMLVTAARDSSDDGR